MRALRFDSFGQPDVLEVAEVPRPSLPSPGSDGAEARIAVKAASVNPSDLKNVAGEMAGTVLPRVPGRDFAGTVVEGPQRWVGVDVWGTGGDLGFTRDGSHAELLAVPASALVRKPGPLSFAQASAIGLNFVVAWLGTIETARLEAGETIAVFGVSGGVGGAVAQVAHARGARVIGVDRVEPAEGSPARSVIQHYVPLAESEETTSSEIRKRNGGEGVDVVYDAVGGVTTAAALASLGRRGRLVVISAIGTRTVEIDLTSLYRNETRIMGADSRKLDVAESSKRLAVMGQYFESGLFRPLPISHRYALEEGKDAYRAVSQPGRGRVVLCP